MLMSTQNLSIAEKSDRHSQLPPLMRTFERWTLIFFIISVCDHLFNHFVLHKHGYMSFPLTPDPSYHFADFWLFAEKFNHFHTVEFFQIGFPINYPATVAVVFQIFFKYFAPYSTTAFVTLIVLTLMIPAGLFAKTLIRRGIAPRAAWRFVAITWLLSWPVALIIDGGNAEILVWIAMLIGLWAYATGREWTAAIFLGLAASLKLFPFVFLALFLSRRQFPKLLAGAATFLIASVVSLKILGPTISIAYHGILYGLSSFKVNYMAMWHIQENGVDHSLFALIKFTLILAFHHVRTDFSGSLRAYLFLTAVGGTIAYFTYIRKLPLLNQVLILSIVSIYLTAFSGDGTLIHLYYPLAMLFLLAIKAWRDGVTIPGLSTAIYCMVWCLSFESFLVVPYQYLGARFIGQMHSIGLTVLLITALRYPFGPPLSEDRGEIVLSEPVTGWVKGVQDR